jgi:hypothetical protein
MTSSSPAYRPSLAALLLAGALARASVAFAEDGVEPPQKTETDAEVTVVDDGADGELIVFGDLQIAERRKVLDRSIREQGYRSGERKDGRTVYRPETPWKPTVIVHDDGFVQIKRSPVRFAPPGQRSGSSKLRYLWCLPPLTPMCVRIGGQIVSKRKLNPQKARVLNATHDEVEDWTDAISGKAISQKVGQTLPDELDRLWADGVRLGGHAGELSTPEARRAEMLLVWADRTCTPEGDAVAEVIALFLLYEVQGSPFPATRAEQERANAATSCTRRLDLPFAPLPAP